MTFSLSLDKKSKFRLFFSPETLCLSPNVSLSNLSPAVSSAVSTLRSLSFVIRSEVRLNCNMSYETIFNWEVYHLNSSTGDRELRISRNGSSELRIRRRLLSVGNHLVQLTVGMLGTPVFGVGRGFIRVASSPLLALITGGTKVERGFNTTFVLNASLSRDPDDHNELSGKIQTHAHKATCFCSNAGKKHNMYYGGQFHTCDFLF